MSWNCPLCNVENTTGVENCKGCGVEVKQASPEVEEEEPKLTEEEIAKLVAIGDRFGSLITNKGMTDVLKPGTDFIQATELFIRASAARIATGNQDLATGLLIAISWGIYLAENGATRLTTDLTRLH